MPRFHYLTTRRNRDGSFDTPSLDQGFVAEGTEAAVDMARRFPIDRFDGGDDIAWVVDEGGQVVWSRDLAVPDAA